MANRRQHILQTAPRRIVIKHFVGRDQGNTEAPRALAQAHFLRDFLLAPMARDHAVKPIAESIAQVSGNLIHIRLASTNSPGSLRHSGESRNPGCLLVR